MARNNAFGIKIDVAAIDGLVDRLAGLTPERVGALMVDAINTTADTAYDLSRTAILRGINLTDEYVQRKMRVDHATAKHPEAAITAFGGRGNLTSLSHYGAMQLTGPDNWTNARIRAAGHTFGNWPGWTQRTGNQAIGIAADSKAAGRSVEVVRGRRKKMGSAFALPGKLDGDGNPIIFQRPHGSRKVKALTGPSVYQLFRVASGLIEDQVYGDLERAVVDAAEREILRELT